MQPNLQNAIVDMSRTYPPLVPAVFDPEYRVALSNVMTRFTPSEMVGAHRWMGTDADRSAGAAFTGSRLGYSSIDPGRVVVTNGTQSAFNMLLGGLVGRDAALAVEEVTYPSVLVVANRYGFTPCGVSMDDEGMIPEALEELCKNRPPVAMYVMSSVQNPTTVTMSLARREAIVAVARKYNLQIVEDDIYSLMQEERLPPLSALAPERSWYMLGTGKSIASGLKICYVVAPDANRAEALFWPGVRATYWMAAPINAAVSTQLIENGGAWRVIDAVRAELARRYAVIRPLVSCVDTVIADGALHLWVRLPEGMSADRFANQVRLRGIAVSTGSAYAAPGIKKPEAVRVCVGQLSSHTELADAVQSIVAVHESERKEIAA